MDVHAEVLAEAGRRDAEARGKCLGERRGRSVAAALIAEIAKKEEARVIQLVLRYAPVPPCDAGSPDTAGAANAQHVRDRYTDRAWRLAITQGENA